jgi:hypothetical protein
MNGALFANKIKVAKECFCVLEKLMSLKVRNQQREEEIRK